MDHVAGYCVVNDVSERAFQNERSGQWTKGKSHDTFGPIGPWLVTADEVADPQDLKHVAGGGWPAPPGRLHRTMIFRVPYLVSYLSPVHEPAAGRHHLHGHPARGRHGEEAASVPAPRPNHAARHPRAWRTDPGHRGGLSQPAAAIVSAAVQLAARFARQLLPGPCQASASLRGTAALPRPPAA